MNPLKIVGTMFFYIHYYTFFIFKTIFNLLQDILKKGKIMTIPQEKQYASLYDNTHPHVFKDTQDLILEDGYHLEIHTFQTKDGVSVKMWRIFKQENTHNKLYPILLMHGLLDCSVSWFLQHDKQKTLPYMLANLGYDVWVGNNRGNRVTVGQQNLPEQYWDYNFDHLVDFDFPAILEGVLEKTKKQKLIYIGHSQGSTQCLLGLNIYPHLAQKIAVFIGLGTVVSLANVKQHTVLKILSKLKLLQFCNIIGFRQILLLPQKISKAVGVLIYNSGFHFNFMMWFVRLLCGFSDQNKIPEQLFGVMITHEPGGASANNALHWVQCNRKHVMHRFDHGKTKNLQIYKSQEPPAYELNHLKDLPFKTYLFRGTKDAVINDTDFNSMVGLFNKQKIRVFQIEDYHHLQYIWSKHAHLDIFEHILRIVNQNSQ